MIGAAALPSSMAAPSETIANTAADALRSAQQTNNGNTLVQATRGIFFLSDLSNLSGFSNLFGPIARTWLPQLADGFS